MIEVGQYVKDLKNWVPWKKKKLENLGWGKKSIYVANTKKENGVLEGAFYVLRDFEGVPLTLRDRE